jgi:Spy/CpxP family protein refolding chaperone
MKKQVLALVGILGVVGVTLSAQPQRARRGGPPQGVDPVELQERLGLSEEQATQLREIHSEQRKAGIRQQADMRIARMELEELLMADTVDEKAVAAKVDQISRLQDKALRARVDTRLAVRKILSPEQARELGKLRQRRSPRGQGRMGPRRPGPWGPGNTPPRDAEAPPPGQRE